MNSARRKMCSPGELQIDHAGMSLVEFNQRGSMGSNPSRIRAAKTAEAA